MSVNESLLARRKRSLGENSPLFFERPLHLTRGSGVWVYDNEGRKYLDVYNNVPHVGHCHPHVVEAISKQSEILNIHTRYLHENVVEYAERLLATFDRPLDVASFVCTGTEANELALRIARNCSMNRGVIVTNFSYHGNSTALAEMTTALPAPEALAPYIRSIAIPDTLSVGPGDGARQDIDPLDRLRAAIESLQREGHGVAAILFDTIFSTEGLLSVPANFVRDAAALVRAAGGFVIADEVQPGLGRTGEAMWGYKAHGIVPDFVTMGKPMGNGHPVGCMVTRSDLLNHFTSKALYFNTFGGNPVSCAAGMAVLDVIEQEQLVANAHAVGAYLSDQLKALQTKHSVVANVRGRGLFFGLELTKGSQGSDPATEETVRLVNYAKDQGVLISKIGPHENVLKMRPPMPFGTEHADILVAVLDDALSAL